MTAPYLGAGKHSSHGWELDDLNRLIASARSMPGTVGPIPAGR